MRTSMAIMAGCILALFLAPVGVLLAGPALPGSFQYMLWVGPQYAFPVHSIRLPDLPSGIQPGPGFRYELGAVPVVVTWSVVVLAFGLLAGGRKPWQALLAAVSTIVLVSVLGHLALRSFGFRLQLEFP